jgi:hypothetical protein
LGPTGTTTASRGDPATVAAIDRAIIANAMVVLKTRREHSYASNAPLQSALGTITRTPVWRFHYGEP